MKPVRTAFLLAISLLCFASCRTAIIIEKRHYSHGYYRHISTKEGERLPDAKSESQEENFKTRGVEQDQVNFVVSNTEQLMNAGSVVSEYPDAASCKSEVVSRHQVTESVELNSPRDTVIRERIVRERTDSTGSSVDRQPRWYKVWQFILLLLGLLIITSIGFLLLLILAAIMATYSSANDAGEWTLIIGSALLLLADAIIIGKSIKKRRAKKRAEENSTEH